MGFTKEKTVVIGKMPETVDELVKITNFKDYYSVAASAIAALRMFPKNKDLSVAMINALKGPKQLSPMDISFIRDRFMDKAYLMDSYFAGATVENNYTPTNPLTVTLYENIYSNNEEGYIVLLIKSAGADSERMFKLRNKPSTGEWFLWSYEGLLTGIRIPKKEDDWA